MTPKSFPSTRLREEEYEMIMLLLRAERAEEGAAAISVEPVSIKENGSMLGLVPGKDKFRILD